MGFIITVRYPSSLRNKHERKLIYKGYFVCNNKAICNPDELKTVMDDIESKATGVRETDEYTEYYLTSRDAQELAFKYAVQYFEEYLPMILWGQLGDNVKSKDGHDASHQTYISLLRETQKTHGKGYYVVCLTIQLMFMLGRSKNRPFPYSGGWSKADAMNELEPVSHREAVQSVLTPVLRQMDVDRDLVVLIEFFDAGCVYAFNFKDALTRDSFDPVLIRRNKIQRVHDVQLAEPI